MFALLRRENLRMRELPHGGRRRDAGGDEVQVRDRGRLGFQTLPRHRPAERMGREGGAQKAAGLASTTGTGPQLEKVRKTIDGTDISQAHVLVREYDRFCYADSGYTGIAKRP